MAFNQDMNHKLGKQFLVGVILMDLSKAFDCIPHDFVFAKLVAKGFDAQTLLYIYSYLENRKQHVKINSTNSNFQEIAS